MLGPESKHGYVRLRPSVEENEHKSPWKLWTDAHYHEVMLLLMIADVILLTWIAFK